MRCYFCSVDLPSFGYVNGNHWTGVEYVRVDLCRACFRADSLKSAPRRPRRPRQRREMVPTELTMAFQLGAMGSGRTIKR